MNKTYYSLLLNPGSSAPDFAGKSGFNITINCEMRTRKQGGTAQNAAALNISNKTEIFFLWVTSASRFSLQANRPVPGAGPLLKPEATG